MDIDAYISSGILENYCMGLCSIEENTVIEKYAEMYPAIKKEIENIHISLEDYFLSNEIKPVPSVKIAVMQSIYGQIALSDSTYAPFIKELMDPEMLAAWVSANKIVDPDEDFENLFITDLPSTEHVTNFIVHAKKGHDTEIHDYFIEYLYVISGSCIMDFEGVKRSYAKGDIIHILPHISHTATITSGEPMIALVQRQACA
jgi:quercetin dioxygenase-like cupin family protein